MPGQCVVGYPEQLPLSHSVVFVIVGCDGAVGRYALTNRHRP